MREKTDDIRDLFVKNDSGVIIDVSRKQGTLECVSVQKFEQENRVSTRWQIIKGQIRHMDKNILWMHLAVCAGIVVLVWTNWFDVQSCHIFLFLTRCSSSRTSCSSPVSASSAGLPRRPRPRLCPCRARCSNTGWRPPACR